MLVYVRATYVKIRMVWVMNKIDNANFLTFKE